MAGETSRKSRRAAKRAPAKRAGAKALKPQSRKVARLALLAGGNPQIAKADGGAPVQAWNQPLYGVEGQGWFLWIHRLRK